jgi:hypothetical protein
MEGGTYEVAGEVAKGKRALKEVRGAEEEK